MMVTPDARDEWLDPRNRSDLLGLLTPAAPGLLVAHPVSTAVGNVANNSPSLTEPLELEGQLAMEL